MSLHSLCMLFLSEFTSVCTFLTICFYTNNYSLEDYSETVFALMLCNNAAGINHMKRSICLCTHTYTHILKQHLIYIKTADFLSSMHTYTCATRNCHYPLFLLHVYCQLHEGYCVIGLKSYTVLLHSNVLFCTMSSHSGASVNRAIVWSASKGFTPISP